MKNFITFILVFFSAYSLAQNDDFTSFNDSINEGQRKIDRSKQLLPYDQLHTLIADMEDLEKNTKSAPSSNKKTKDNKKGSQLGSQSPYKKESVKTDAEKLTDFKENAAKAAAKKKATAKKAAKKQTLKKPVQAKVKTYQYVSPLFRKNEGQGINTAAVSMPSSRYIRYGINIGTEIKVELAKGASNIQPGYIAVILKEDVVGYKDTLPKGSKFFAKANAVLGSDRLYLTASKVLNIDDNSEITVNGIIRAIDGNAGLLASIITDPRDFDRVVTAGENAVFSSLVNSIATNTIAGSAVSAAGNTLFDQKSQQSKFENGQTILVIEAPPQSAILIIEESF